MSPFVKLVAATIINSAGEKFQVAEHTCADEKLLVMG